MQWNHVGNTKAIVRTTPFANRQPVCFAHEGFAVAGAARERSVYIWDAERGDQLLSLDHGGESPKYFGNTTQRYDRGFQGTRTSGALNAVLCEVTYANLAV
jgi:hypothetical protein